MMHSNIAVMMKFLAKQLEAKGSVTNFSVKEKGNMVSIGKIELDYTLADGEVTADGKGAIKLPMPDEAGMTLKGSSSGKVVVSDVTITMPDTGFELKLEHLEFEGATEGFDFLLELMAK